MAGRAVSDGSRAGGVSNEPARHAFDEGTAIAEARPDVGALVAVAEFEVTSDLTVLGFAARFVDYVPTQIVTEFVREFTFVDPALWPEDESRKFRVQGLTSCSSGVRRYRLTRMRDLEMRGCTASVTKYGRSQRLR